MAVVSYFESEDLPALGLEWYENGRKLDLSSGYNFYLKIGNPVTYETLLTKDTGIFGYDPALLPEEDDPNLIVLWSAGDLDSLTPGTYLFQFQAVDTTSGKDRFTQIEIPIKRILK